MTNQLELFDNPGRQRNEKPVQRPGHRCRDCKKWTLVYDGIGLHEGKVTAIKVCTACGWVEGKKT